MNAPARRDGWQQLGQVVSRLEIFRTRAEARAAQWQAGEISLTDAVDLCQRLAEALGLVIERGQDEVQAVMVDVFAPLREDLRADNAREPHDVPTATLQAAEYLLQLGDLQKWKKWFDHRNLQERQIILEHLEQVRKQRRRGK